MTPLPTGASAPPDYITRAELLGRLGISRDMLRRAIREDGFPHPLRLTPNGKLLWPRRVVEEHLARRFEAAQREGAGCDT
jgi:predicted DNA-binding transcriptional regulator AlpA